MNTDTSLLPTACLDIHYHKANWKELPLLCVKPILSHFPAYPGPYLQSHITLNEL